MMTVSTGHSTIKETILDGRFKYAGELAKLGAQVSVVDGGFLCVNGARGQVLHVAGVEALVGAEVLATDIRGGAAVVLAALGANGTTTMTNIYQLERGYEDLPGMLRSLGARVERMAGVPATETPSVYAN